MMGNAKFGTFTTALRACVEGYRRFQANKPHGSTSWIAARQLIQNAESLDRYARVQLEAAVVHSNATLAPLADPLGINLGSHRWLSGDREESYSDWLAWILQGLTSASEVLTLMGVDDAGALKTLQGVEHEVAREGVSEYGRTDLEVRFGTRGLLVIEVKTKPPGTGLSSQLKRYVQWAERQSAATRLFVYLGLDTPDVDIGPFTATSWAAVCRLLRSYAVQRLKTHDAMRAAAVLIFCGAAEQNLLDVSANPRKFRAMASVDYLAGWRGRK